MPRWVNLDAHDYGHNGLIHQGNKFVSLALSVVGCDIEEWHAGEGLSVSNSLPFTISEFWRIGLGRYICDMIAEANLFITCQAPAKAPGIVDGQFRELWTLGNAMFLAANLVGFKFLQKPLPISGEYEQEPLPRRVSPFSVSVYWPSDQLYPNRVTQSRLDEAAKLASQIFRLSSMPATHKRLARGVAVLKLAWACDNQMERLMQLVRALDALLATPQGKGRQKFFERLSPIVESTARPTWLPELYDFRNRIVHLHDFGGIVPDVSEDDFSSFFEGQLVRAEIATTELYKAVLMSEQLMYLFEEDSSINGNWENNQIPSAFGSSVDVDEVWVRRKQIFAAERPLSH